MQAGKQLSFAEKLMAGKLGKEEKKLIEFIKPVDPTIKTKLHNEKLNVKSNDIFKKKY